MIRIDNELMLITGISTNALTVTRGAVSTPNVAHDDGSMVVVPQPMAALRGAQCKRRECLRACLSSSLPLEMTL